MGGHMKVLTIGTFDLFHVGHLNLLERAAKHGDLYVGVNTDRFVTDYKGRAPVIPEAHRLRIIRAIACVQDAYLNDGRGRDLIEHVMPDCIAIGGDWHERGYLKQIDVSQEWLDRNRVTVAYVPHTPGISTTQLRASA